MKSFQACLALLLALCACAKPIEQPAKPVSQSSPKPIEPKRAWTIAVLMPANSSLYQWALEDINEMEQGLGQASSASEDIEVIVLFDGQPKGDSKLLRIRPDPGPLNVKVVSETLDDRQEIIPASKEIDSGDPAVWGHFLDYVTRHYPARHVAVTTWQHRHDVWMTSMRQQQSLKNHSFFTYLTTEGPSDQPRKSFGKSFAADDFGSAMVLSDLYTGLAKARQNLGHPIDIVGFDADFMLQIETSYQLNGLAKLLIASPDTTPGAGWNYAAWLGALSQNPDMSPETLVQHLANSYKAFFTATGDEVSLSAVDIEKVSDKLVPLLEQLGHQLKSHLPEQARALQNARTQARLYNAIDTVDLGHFLKLYAASKPPAEIQSLLTQIQDVMSDARRAHVYTHPIYEPATGYQLYFPSQEMVYDTRYDDPLRFRFAENKGWRDFLKAFAKSSP